MVILITFLTLEKVLGCLIIQETKLFSANSQQQHLLDNMERILILLFVPAIMAVPFFNKKSSSFNSTKEMKELIKTEETLFWILDNYTNHLETRANKLKMFHEEFKKASESSSNGVEEYLDNPVNSFLFARRLLVTWKEVEKIMSGDVGKEITREISLRRLIKGIKLPSDNDLSFAATQVKKLQDTYQLTAKEMADGGPYGIPLNSGDCFEMGKEAYEADDYEHAFDWLQEALSRASDGRSIEAETIEYLAAVAYLKGRLRKALNLTERLLELQPKHPKAQGNLKFYKKKLTEIQRDRNAAIKKDIVMDLVNWQEEDMEEFTNSLCEGNVTISEKVRSSLRCRLSDRRSPFLILAPFKEEDVFLNPRVVLYHGALTEEEIKFLKDSFQNPIDMDVDRAIGAQSAFVTVSDEHMSAVNKRTSDFSGLNLDNSDLLRIIRFEQDGAYKPHLDGQERINSKVRKSGTKMATVQYFLDDSEGGDAVFPALKLTVPPQKGSALVWFNTLRSGAFDDLSIHGTCTVRSEQHWEAVKWVRSFGNEVNRPCGKTDKF